MTMVLRPGIVGVPGAAIVEGNRPRICEERMLDSLPSSRQNEAKYREALVAHPFGIGTAAEVIQARTFADL